MALRVDDVDLGRDRSLVEQFQAGDAAAFDDLYRRYYPRLYRFCLKRVGDSHEAEEVTQEAFTRAFRSLDRFAGERRFYPWMTVIAGRLCVDTHRRRARTEPSDRVDLGVVDGGQEAIVNLVDVKVLNDAIANLAPRHQEVLELRERQGLSYQHIADHYGVTLGTVEALLWRARKALRREFLALSDDDHAGAALPVAAGAAATGGWLARSFGRLGRLAGAPRRAAGFGWTGFAPVGAGLATLAVVGGLALGVSGGDFGFRGGSARPVPAVRFTGVAGSFGSAIAAPATATGRSAATPTRLPGTTSRGPGSATSPLPWTQVGSADQGQRETSQGKQVQVLGLGAGVDPNSLARETQSAIHNIGTVLPPVHGAGR